MILIVDSNEKLRHFLVSIIQDQVDEPSVAASSFKEMIWHLQKIHFDLLILQNNLNDGDAIKYIKKIRRTHGHLQLPIILLGAQDDRKLILEGFAAGINDYITIPFDPRIAMARIKCQLHILEEHHHQLATTPTGKIIQEREADYEQTTPPTANVTTFREEPDPFVISHAAVPVARDEAQETTVEDEVSDRPIPCEMPVSLIIKARSYFCKSLWVAHHGLLLLTFEEIPKEEIYEVQLLNPEGGTINLQVKETDRVIMDANHHGNLKVKLRILDAPKEFDQMYTLFANAYKKQGLEGIKSILRGEAVSSSISEMESNLDTPEKKNNTVSFTSAASSLNIIAGTRYKFVREVGRGGFATVILAEDNALKRPIAMKILNRDFSKVEQARYSFLCEAQIAAQFHHPNIVFVFEVGELFAKQYSEYLDFPKALLDAHPERLIYFTMQYVEGVTLSKWIKDGNNSDERQCVKVMMEILKALAFAHEKDVIHRDIKPDNIMITPNEQVLVTDFGIATLAKSSEPKKVDGEKVEIACTPKYASPEQLRGKKMDGRADLYSFGVVAYEILTGSPPFKGKSLMEIVGKQLKAKPAPIESLRADVSPELANAITRCLAKNPEKRYQSAQDLLDDLSKLLGEQQSPELSAMKTLDSLISDLISAHTEKEAIRDLEQINAFLKLHKTSDNAEQLNEIKIKLSDASFVNIVIEKLLSKGNRELLFEFFSTLEAGGTVSKLLNRFCVEYDSWKKLILGELAIISAGRDLMPLATFGLELTDEDAALLLRGFSVIMPRCSEPIYFKWAHHHGQKTQLELLKTLSILKRNDRETLQVLEFFANAGGTQHQEVQQTADRLLNEKEWMPA